VEARESHGLLCGNREMSTPKKRHRNGIEFSLCLIYELI
jgi:hypothetical protein